VNVQNVNILKIPVALIEIEYIRLVELIRHCFYGTEMYRKQPCVSTVKLERNIVVKIMSAKIDKNGETKNIN
jgi:hypothetical protein